MLGLGPYTFKARAKMLQYLLEIQKSLCDDGHAVSLITNEELREIRRQWLKRGLIDDYVPKIYYSVYKEELNCEKNDVELINNSQYEKIQSLCIEQQVYIEPLIEMLNLEKNNTGNRIKSDLSKKINEILTKDYLHM